ncbi:MAG TPA: prepilin-type N-terminal cleavage/methylation domain-containing protein [Bryobacteraceae bacterium]|jgi:prepilin-type N-terminal cleavage/methylation domain-containing protein|nr:prepilin-type N-terminal cleavage/methylation domain-containing protein [Bryobacteraceae bacterium]
MKQRGVTLMEVLISVTLLSLLSVAMFMAMRIGLNAYVKADAKLMDNRRTVGAQRILADELGGIMPVMAACGAGSGAPGSRAVFFQGAPGVMRLATTFSLLQGSRGQPQIVALFVIPGEDDRGVRLVVNETPYTGASAAGRFCTAPGQFAPVEAGAGSFVLADKLAYCRFSYLAPPAVVNQPPGWTAVWNTQRWPLAIRIEMAPLATDSSRVQPISLTAPVYLHRSPEIQYEDLGIDLAN